MNILWPHTKMLVVINKPFVLRGCFAEQRSLNNKYFLKLYFNRTINCHL